MLCCVGVCWSLRHSIPLQYCVNILSDETVSGGSVFFFKGYVIQQLQFQVQFLLHTLLPNKMIFLGGETYRRWKRISRLFSLKMKIFTWVKQYTRPGIGRIKIYRQNNVFQAHKCLPVFNCVPEVETVVVDSRKERRPMWRPETVRGHHPRYVKQQQQQHSNRHAYKQRYSRNISTAGIKSINE